MSEHFSMKNLFLIFLFISCSTAPKKPNQTIVLIQGVHVDGSVWTELRKSLKESGFNLMDLNRLGRDAEEPASLSKMAGLSCQQIPPKSILVAHSYGGAIANQMTGVCPEKVSRIIYVSAIVPLKNEKPFDLMNKTDQRNYSRVVTFGKFKIIPKDAMTYFKGTDPLIKKDQKLPDLHSEWISLISEDINYDENIFKGIPKSYIYTKNDPVLSLTTQFQYTSRTKIKDVIGIATGHYPMISNPKKLSEFILKIANKN